MERKITSGKFLNMMTFSFLALNFVSFSSQVSILIGTDGIIPLLVSGGVMYGYLFLIIRLMMRDDRKSYYEVLISGLGKFVGRVVYFLHLCVIVYLYCYAIRIVTTQVSVYMLPGKNIYLIQGIFIFATVYSAQKGLRAMGNFCSVLLYPVIFMLAFLFFLSSDNMDIKNMLPIFTHGGSEYLRAIMHLLSYNFSGVLCVPFIIDEVNMADSSISKKALWAFLSVAAIFSAYYVLCIGVLGVDTCRSIVFPAINIMHNSSSSGILLNRYEIIIVFIVVILYFLYCSLFLYSALKGAGRMKKKGYLAYIVSFTGIFFILSLLNDKAAGEYIAKMLHMKGYLGYSFVVMIVLCVFLLWRKNEKKN